MTTGQVNCVKAATGNILWTENLGPQHPSPVITDGLVYIPGDNGIITVFKPGPKFESVSKNATGGKMDASTDICNGKIYFRGYKNLFFISKTEG